MPPLSPLNNPPPPQSNPNQQPAPGTTPYDFFLDQHHKQKRPSFNPRHSSGLVKFLLSAVAVFVLLIIIAIVANISRSSHKTVTPGLAVVLQDQQEIINLGTDAASHSDTTAALQNFAVTAVAVTTTAQQQMLVYVARNDNSLSTANIATFKDANIANQLVAAEAASNYEATYRSVTQQLLTAYQAELQLLHGSSTIGSEQTILENNLASVQLLKKMLAE
jgi:hypothetical protein